MSISNVVLRHQKENSIESIYGNILQSEDSDPAVIIPTLTTLQSLLCPFGLLGRQAFGGLDGVASTFSVLVLVLVLFFSLLVGEGLVRDFAVAVAWAWFSSSSLVGLGEGVRVGGLVGLEVGRAVFPEEEGEEQEEEEDAGRSLERLCVLFWTLMLVEGLESIAASPWLVVGALSEAMADTRAAVIVGACLDAINPRISGRLRFWVLRGAAVL